MGHAVLHCPLLDTGSYSIGDGTIQTRTIVNHVDEFLIDILGKILIHLLTVKHLLAEILVRAFCGCLHFNGLFLKSLTYNLKS